jgi:hypothetical protein
MATNKATKKKKGSRELTLKQTKLVRALPTAKSVSEAGRKAGYSDAPTAHRALASIREKMPDVLERHGLTADFAAQKCLKLMDAKETRFFAKDGMVMETREVEALDVQLRALDAWAKMFGAFREGKVQVDVNHSYHIDLRGVPDAILFGIVDLAAQRADGRAASSGRDLQAPPIDMASGD